MKVRLRLVCDRCGVELGDHLIDSAEHAIEIGLLVLDEIESHRSNCMRELLAQLDQHYQDRLV